MRAQLRRVSHSQDNKRIDFKAVGNRLSAEPCRLYADRLMQRAKRITRRLVRTNLLATKNPAPAGLLLAYPVHFYFSTTTLFKLLASPRCTCTM